MTTLFWLFCSMLFSLVAAHKYIPMNSVGDLGPIPELGRSPGGGHGNPPQYFCLENPHGQRSLVGYSPWGCKEWDTTEQLSTAVCGLSPLGFYGMQLLYCGGVPANFLLWRFLSYLANVEDFSGPDFSLSILLDFCFLATVEPVHPHYSLL